MLKNVSPELIENVKDLKIALNELTVYDLNVYSMSELYYKVAHKLNEVINELSRFEGVLSDEVIKQNEKLIYLLGEGLEIEVVKEIDNLIKKGFFEDIINVTLFENLNNKLNEVNTKLCNLDNTNKDIFININRLPSMTNMYKGRHIIMLGDSHTWGEGSQNYQGIPSGYNIHSGWKTNDSFLNKTTKYLKELYNCNNVTKSIPTVKNRDYDVYNMPHFYKVNGRVEYNNISPSLLNGLGSELALTPENGEIFESVNEMYMQNNNDNTFDRSILNFKAFDGVYMLENCGYTNRDYVTTSSDKLVFYNSYNDNNLLAFTITKENNLLPKDKVYLKDFGICQIELIGDNESNEDLVDIFVIKDSGENFTVDDIKNITDGKLCKLSIAEFYLDSYSDHSILKMYTNKKSPIIKLKLDFDDNLGNEAPEVYYYVGSTDYNKEKSSALIDNINHTISLDLYNAEAEFVTFEINHKQYKRGRIRMYFGGYNSNVSYNENTLIQTKGFIHDNNDLIKCFGLGGHTIGAWLGEEDSYWNETRNHINDIRKIMRNEINGAIVQLPIVNEYIKQTPLNVFTQRIDRLIESLNTNNIIFVTSLGGKIQEFETDSANIKYNDYFNTAKNHITQKRITYFDGRKYIKDYINNLGLDYNYLYFNDNHPSNMFHNLMFEKLKELVLLKF